MTEPALSLPPLRQAFETYVATVMRVCNLPRLEAECAAFDIVLVEHLNATHPDTDPLRCAWCRRRETRSNILLLAIGWTPAAAQWRGGHDGDWGWRAGEAGASDPYFSSPWGSPGEAGASDPDWSDDSCWQVRPIYSVSGAWLDNRRVNVCH